MTEHKWRWLTEKEVADFVGSMNKWEVCDEWKVERQLIADRREMRKILTHLVADVEADARMRGVVGKLPWFSLRDAIAMLEATADKPISHELADGKLNDGISTTGQGIDYLRGRDD